MATKLSCCSCSLAKSVGYILRGLGVDDIHYAYLPGFLTKRTKQVGASSGMFHLDMCFGMANPKVAVLWPGGVDYDTVKWLQEDKGVDIIFSKISFSPIS
ncbi:unnamed protein product [marine sediment metagenome]|uniref:Uncharacterized protein n=1 Tax=marine sediment metagenome TaxID=412755 RepID=X1S9C4_9ZZZZ